MSDLTIKLFSKVSFPVIGQRIPNFRWTDYVSALNLELGVMGYTMDASLLNAFSMLTYEEFEAQREALVATLRTLSGVNANHTRLFNGFPYEVPEQREYLVKRIISFIANMDGVTRNECTVLECGHAIDTDMLPLAEFGACPVCQFQVSDLRSPSGERYRYVDLTPLKVLGYATHDDLGALARDIIGRQSSISADEKAFVLSQKDNFSFKRPDAIFRENIPLLYSTHGRIAARKFVSTATDVLRIATHLSSDTADLSLNENVKFKIKTSDKRSILSLLDNLDSLTEDMMRNRERWLRLGERLNPGSKKNRLRYPSVAAAFDELRNAPKGIQTFNRTIEKGMRSKDINLAFLNELATRPGEYARRLDALLRSRYSDSDTVINVFSDKVVAHIPMPMLFMLVKYFDSRGYKTLPGPVASRIFIPKGTATKMKVVEDTRLSLTPAAVWNITAAIRKEVNRRLSELPDIGQVYVDPALRKVLLPFNKRGDSSTTTPIMKGSRFPFEGEFVRLFVHWTGNIDVDLSCALYDADFKGKGFVGFQNLADTGIYHSGDIQTAPNGASEFIDFDIKKLRQRGVRYVASSIILFAGRGHEDFSTFPCFAGFMQRDGLRSGAVYEPASLAVKFDVNAKTTSAQPLIFDLQMRDVIFADLSGGKSQFGAMGNQQDKHRIITEAVLSLPDRKPTVYDIVLANVMARGRLVPREDASKVYDLTNVAEALADFTI